MNEEDKTTTSDSLYLQQLTFKKKDSKTWLNFFIHNFRVTILIVLAILIWGLYSLSQLPLESNPEVKIPFGVVAVALPGASPSSMEELVVKKIEKKVANLSGVKTVTSSALNSLALVTVEFRAEEDLKDAIRRLRDAVATLKSDLPAEATDPQVNEVSFSNTPVWTVVVTGPYDNFTLKKYAEKVKDELEKLPGTNDVLVSGGDSYDIRILYNPQKLESYGLSLDQVNATIRASNVSLPLGTMEVSNFEYTVQLDSKFTSAAQLRELPISTPTGQAIRLKEVATVMERAKERTVYNLFSINGATPQNAVTLNIVKKTGSSIIELIDGGKAKIDEVKKTLPQNLAIETTLDFSTIIRRDLTQLEHDGIITVLIVSTILFLFVGLKEAFVAGLAVPLVFCATFAVMKMTGLTLNFLSLFSLILSLGLLVDDAIVVVQATKQYLKTGKFTPEEAVLLVFHDYKVLLTTTTLTTIWAFIPLLLATGIIGQFIRSIPITVSVTLAASFVIAIIINHPMAIILERFRLTRSFFYIIFGILGLGAILSITQKSFLGIILFASAFFALLRWYRSSLKQKLLKNEDRILEELADPEKIKAKIRHHYRGEGEKNLSSRLINGIIKLEDVLSNYGNVLRTFLVSRTKTVVLLVIVGVLFIGSVALPATGILKSEFIPPADSEYLYINIEGPQGLIVERTREIATQVQKVIETEPAIKNFSLVLGAGGVDISGGGASSGGSATAGGQTNLAQFAINLYPIKERPKTGPKNRVEKSYDIAQRLRKGVEPIQGAQVRVVEMSGGPPTGADFEAQIVGPDLTVLQRETNKLKDLLAQIPGAINVRTSIRLSPGEFTFKLNPDKLQLHGITAGQVAGTLRTALSGAEITKVLQGEEEFSVRAEFDENLLKDVNALESLSLSNNRGQLFRLGDVATVELQSSLTSISRIDQKRALVLSAAVEKPHLPAEILSAFQAKVATQKLPDGYEIIFGGQNDTNAESVLSILRAMIVAMILIVGTLVIQFNSFRKSILVLATIPLAMTGVFIGLTLTGFTLTFPGLIGILALFGIVVKNAVILIDKINLNLRVGIPFVDAIVDASKSRLEAILLTSICTIFGMIPLTLSNETWAGLGMSLIFGLISSTFLTLFVIPVLFNIFVKKSYEKDEKLRALKTLSS